MPKPNFFIVGAAKAGTSSLWYYLNQHPQVFMPNDELNKEPRYFSHPNRFKTFEEYLRLFKEARQTHVKIGEASTTYLMPQDCAKKIAEYERTFDLKIKIIIMLRNPVDRAYSLYNWMAQEGYEYSGSFSKALQRESRRKNGVSKFWEPEYYYNYLYFHSGLYFSQVARYINLFGRERVYIGIFEEFINKKQKVLNEILSFLEIKPIDLDTRAIINPSYQVYSPAIQFTLRKINKILIKSKVLNFKNKAERDKIMALGITNNKVPRIDPYIRQILLSKYRADIMKLEELLNIDLSLWITN